MVLAKAYLLKSFKPDICITLIDDIQDIWARLKLRYEDDATNGYFRLDEIANWRTIEIAVADLLAEEAISDAQRESRGLGMMKNHVMAIKHPVENLYRLLFERENHLLVYACCGITKPRDNPQLRLEVDQYRSELHQNYIVYDPLTIDEGPIRSSFFETFPHLKDVRGPDPQLAGGSSNEVPYVKILPTARWPLVDVPRLVPGLSTREADLLAYQGIPANEVVRLCYQRDDDSGDVIFDHIKQRDFRLIDQSDIVPAWRPVLGGQISGGQNSELIYADASNKPSVIYWPPEDHEPLTPFRWRGARRRTKAKFYQAIQDRAGRNPLRH